MKNIVVIGATSAIAMACMRRWALDKANLYLIARNQEKLNQVKQDLLARGAAAVYSASLDVNDLDQHEQILNQVFETLTKVDVVLIAHGTLPNQSVCEGSAAKTLQEINTNGLSVISLLTILANRMGAQQHGTLAVITSVAGDRGRPSNYVYGSAKALVSTFCEGLRAALFKKNVHVLTIKPGFVDTPMTQGLALPKRLVVKPERIANDITRAIQKQQNVLYTPGFWRWIMNIIRVIPGPIFKRLTL